MTLQQLLRTFDFDDIFPTIAVMYPNAKRHKKEFQEAFDILCNIHAVTSKKNILYQLIEDPNTGDAFFGAMDGNFKTKQTAVSDPTASGTALSFIDSISQDENGEITPSKKTVQDGTTSQKGVVQLEDSYASTSTTKAATPNSVKSAYDLANGKYSKPSDGIPKSDLASGVQSSLDKADSALQGVKLAGSSSALTPDSDKVVTVPNAVPTGTGETNGLMTAADKSKLDGITSGANKVEASNTNGNIKIDETETNVYTHPSAGPSSATSVGDTTNQTPAFGGTFKAISQTVNTDGHTTATTEHTVTWTSSNSNMASVDANGKVTALSGGNVTIAAKAGGKSAVCMVVVIVPVESVTLNQSSLTLGEGESATLRATVTPKDATDFSSVSWSSSDESVATVDQNGGIRAIREGSAHIVAKAGDKQATCTVTVIKRVSSISLDQNSLTLLVGKSSTLMVTVLPEDATDKTVTWESYDTNVATVENGVVKGIDVGWTTITATAGNVSATCSVLVVLDSADGWRCSLRNRAHRYHLGRKQHYTRVSRQPAQLSIQLDDVPRNDGLVQRQL